MSRDKSAAPTGYAGPSRTLRAGYQNYQNFRWIIRGKQAAALEFRETAAFAYATRSKLLLGLAFGFALGRFPLCSFTLGGFPLRGFALGGFPLRGFALGGLPLRSLPLGRLFLCSHRH